MNSLSEAQNTPIEPYQAIVQSAQNLEHTIVGTIPYSGMVDPAGTNDAAGTTPNAAVAPPTPAQMAGDSIPE